MRELRLKITSVDDLTTIMGFVEQFHIEEGLPYTEATTRIAVCALLGASTFGRIWLIMIGSKPVGYVAICFGYSIEFIGRDAILDEFFIRSDSRGNGISSAVLSMVKVECEFMGLKALHVEVSKHNELARSVYESSGLKMREDYHLMSEKLGAGLH